MKTRPLRPLLLCLATLLAASPALADELDELRALRDTTVSLLNLLVQQGVLSREKADELIHQAEQAAAKGAAKGAPAGTAVAGAPTGTTSAGAPTGSTGAGVPAGNAPAATPVAPGVVRVPYVPELVKQEIREEVKQDVLAQAHAERWGEPGAMPEWVHRITWSGDVRLRFQGDRFPTSDVPNATPQQLAFPQAGAWPLTDTSDPINILRFRARFGMEAALGSTVTAGIRLASGGVGLGTNSSSESQTLGNYNARESVGFDRAYLAYRPLSWFTVTGGRLGNPFLTPTTLVWASDLSLEGVTVGFNPQLSKSFGVFATAGAFPILDVEPSPLSSSRAKWLFGYQAGLHWHLGSDSALHAGVGLYDYKHLEGIPNPDIFSTIYSATAAPFRQGGNSVFDINQLVNTQNGSQNYLIGLASRFRELNGSVSLDLGFGGRTHVVLDLDYVKNLGFDRSEILARTGLDLAERTSGGQARIAVGDPAMTRKYAWQGFIGYRYVQRDAVVDAFTDADFHLGGTDTQGYFLGGEFAFETHSTLRVRWMSGKQIDGLPLAIDVLQIDATTSF